MLLAVRNLVERFDEILDDHDPNSFGVEWLTCLGHYILGDASGLFNLLVEYNQRKIGYLGRLSPELFAMLSRIRGGDQDSVQQMLSKCLAADSTPRSLDRTNRFVSGFFGLSLGQTHECSSFVSEFIMAHSTEQQRVFCNTLLRGFVGNSKEALAAMQPARPDYNPFGDFLMGTSLTMLDGASPRDKAVFDAFARELPQYALCAHSHMLAFVGAPQTVNLEDAKQIFDSQAIEQVATLRIGHPLTDVGYALGLVFDSSDSASDVAKSLSPEHVRNASSVLWGKSLVGILASISERQADVISIAAGVGADTPYAVSLISLAADVVNFTPQDAKVLTKNAGLPHPIMLPIFGFRSVYQHGVVTYQKALKLSVKFK